MKRIHIILIIIVAVGIGVIITSLTSASTTVGFTKALANEGKEYQIKGALVKTKTVDYNPEKNPNGFSFYMTDKEGNECQVLFNGAKPQDFERSDEIVLTGKMVGDKFHASKMLMKCPSKYNDGKEQIEFKEVKSAS